MKHSGSIEINKPIKLVTELFADPTHLKEYQDGFVNKVLLEGKQGENGAVSKMYYKYNEREMVLTETIISNELPSFFHAEYHHKHMDNWMKCRFTEITPEKNQVPVRI